jgi:hypothetical protein
LKCPGSPKLSWADEYEAAEAALQEPQAEYSETAEPGVCAAVEEDEMFALKYEADEAQGGLVWQPKPRFEASEPAVSEQRYQKFVDVEAPQKPRKKRSKADRLHKKAVITEAGGSSVPGVPLKATRPVVQGRWAALAQESDDEELQGSGTWQEAMMVLRTMQLAGSLPPEVDVSHTSQVAVWVKTCLGQV